MPSSGPPAVFVTRPAREAQAWVQALAGLSLEALALPLIDIGPAPDVQALSSMRSRLAQFRAVMFVSANAAQGLLNGHTAWPAGTRAWVTGPGTARALREAGVPPGCIDAPAADAAQFDSEALWAVAGPQVRPCDTVLIVRGGDASGQASGRDWLASQLEAAGAQVQVVVAYVRGVPAWSQVQRDRARAGAQDGAWWLFSSSEAIDNLGRLLPGVGWGQARALCTHPRIAERARQAGFGLIEQVRPSLEAVGGFLQSRS